MDKLKEFIDLKVKEFFGNMELNGLAKRVVEIINDFTVSIKNEIFSSLRKIDINDPTSLAVFRKEWGDL